MTDRNLPGLQLPADIAVPEKGLVKVDPSDGRYYTLEEMIRVSAREYSKEDAKAYWTNDLREPELDRPPQPTPDWFSKLFGFSEASYSEIKRWLEVTPSADGRGQRLVSKANGKSFACGRFETPRLDELRARLTTVQLQGRLTVTNDTGDAATFHALEMNRHATFQVASQFNCLEFVGPSSTPEQGVTIYVKDRTQGPACSVACGPATVFRNYFARTRKDGSEQYGQTQSCMIDNLEDVSALIGNVDNTMYTVQGGYSQSTDEKLENLNARIKDMRASGVVDQIRAALRLGIHEDVQVTSQAWGEESLEDASQTVTQVFGSACAVAYNRGTSPASWEAFARLVLEASYEATLCAAVLAAARHPEAPGARRVFLTSLGGGVFGNPMEWIAEAVRHACEKYKDYALDVRIVTFSGEVHPLLQALAEEYKEEPGK